MKYVIICPVRDEAEHLAATLDALIEQVERPMECVIVNDGSTDTTGQLAEDYARRHPWIRVVHRKNRGFRQAGAGVVDAFYDGYGTIGSPDWEFLIKLDGDLTFSPTYFADLAARFRANPKLGIAGGTLYHLIEGREVDEECPQFHVRGATKVYRRACWDAVGGLAKAPGWDIIDEVKASMLGWTTQTFFDLRIRHHRLTGTAESTWRDSLKNGRAYYFAGYHPLFMAVKCVYRVSRRPYLTGAVGMAWGFISSYFRGAPQVADPLLIQYLRREQMARLLGRETIWR